MCVPKTCSTLSHPCPLATALLKREKALSHSRALEWGRGHVTWACTGLPHAGGLAHWVYAENTTWLNYLLHGTLCLLLGDFQLTLNRLLVQSIDNVLLPDCPLGIFLLDRLLGVIFREKIWGNAPLFSIGSSTLALYDVLRSRRQGWLPDNQTWLESGPYSKLASYRYRECLWLL